MNNIIFAGCSFTWGQGLWMYDNNIDNYIPTAQEWISGINIPNQILDIRKKYRFVEKVSSYIGNIEPISKPNNGGSDCDSLEFIKNNFNKKNTKYIILQTSQLFRNSLNIEIGDKLYKIYSNHDTVNISKVIEYTKDSNGNVHSNQISDNNIDSFIVKLLIENKLNFDDFENILKLQIIENIKKDFSYYESFGVKTLLFSWTNEYIDLIKNDNFFKNKFIYLKYKNKIYNSIVDLQDYIPNMRIDNDVNILRKTGYDSHPSKKCHDIITKNIINSL